MQPTAPAVGGEQQPPSPDGATETSPRA